jgi:hypothetical protein
MNSLGQERICLRIGDVTSRLNVLCALVVSNLNEQEEVVFSALLASIRCNVVAIEILCADTGKMP